MTTQLSAIRKPTAAERKRGAAVVFERSNAHSVYTILACKCYEGWEQWGASPDVLGDNVPAVERWRRRGIE